MTVRRFDRAPLNKPKKAANGWLRADAHIARTGLLEYRRADGSKWVEYRPAAEHSADMLESFDAAPLTNDHPADGILTAENTHEYQVGTVISPRADGDKVRAQILVTDARTVKDIEAGKAELSCGYTCDLEFTPGEFEGQKYDAIQRNIRGNHVALVKSGRAGPEVRLRVDNADSVLIESPKTTVPGAPEGAKMHKITIDGVSYEVSETVATAFAKAQNAAQAALEKEKARADMAEVTAKKATAELAELPAKLKAEAAARMELETKARAHGIESFDGLTDAQIKLAVIAKLLPEVKLDGKPEAYVEASFDLACATPVKKETVTAPVPHADARGNLSALEKARAEFEKFSAEYHRSNLRK